MKIFGHRFGTAWEYHVRGVLWRVHHGVAGRIVGEERDPVQKKTSFFCLEQTTGRVLWEGVVSHEPWWVGIGIVTPDVVFLHGYATPDMPGERGITALDASTGSILWARPEWTLEGRTSAGVLVSSVDRTFVSHLDVAPMTGDVQRVIPAEELFSLQSGVAEDNSNQDVLYPLLLKDEPLDAGTMAMVRDRFPLDTSGIIMECVDLETCVVLDTQEYRAPISPERSQVRAVLHVLEKPSGQELFRDTLADAAFGYFPGAFFVQRDLLFYVRERTTLCAVSLPVARRKGAL